MRKVIIYNKELIFINGIFTWLLNFCQSFQKEYDITILSTKWTNRLRAQLDEMVKTDIYKSDTTYECNTFIHSFTIDEIKTNIKYETAYILLHCNYGEMNINYNFNPNANYIAVSKVAAEGFTKKYNIPCDYTDGLFMRNQKRNRILRLISCTRMLKHKGAERMYELEKQLQAHNIKYRWENYSDVDCNSMTMIQQHPESKIIQCKALYNRDDLLDYIADADYLVQLSDNEGLCCAVHEALLVGTPVIVTDIPVFSFVRNGVYGYRLPLDMQKTDTIIREIMMRIPKGFAFVSNYNEIKSKWGGKL